MGRVGVFLNYLTFNLDKAKITRCNPTCLSICSVGLLYKTKLEKRLYNVCMYYRVAKKITKNPKEPPSHTPNRFIVTFLSGFLLHFCRVSPNEKPTDK